MSTSNDSKKGTSSPTGTTKPDNTKDQASGSKKGVEPKEEKASATRTNGKPDASSKPTMNVTKGDKGSDTKNK